MPTAASMDAKPSRGAMARGPSRREPCIVAWLRAMALSSSERGTRLGMRDWPAGIWAARAEPLMKDRATKCNTSALPLSIRKPSTTLCAIFTANIAVRTRRLSKRSDR